MAKGSRKAARRRGVHKISEDRKAVNSVRQISVLAGCIALLLGAPAHAQEAWIGGASNNWSNGANWLDGSAPTAGGGENLTVSFLTRGGAGGSVYDFAGTFSLNQLLLGQNGRGTLTIATTGGFLQLAGASPQILAHGLGDTQISVPLILAPTSGEVSITGTGSGNVTLSAAISSAGGTNGLVINSSPLVRDSQVITLSGANTFSGGVKLQSGNLSLGGIQALGTGPLTVSGGTVQFGTANLSLVNPVQLDADLTVTGNLSGTITGPISSSSANAGLNVRIASQQTLTLASASGHRGVTTIDRGFGSFSAGTLRLANNASLLNSSGISVRDGGILLVEATSVTTPNRLPDTAPISLVGGQLTLNGAMTETVGRLSIGGQTTVVTPTSAPAVLNATALTRDGRGTVLFRGAASLGSSTGGGVSRIMFGTAPALVGGGGTGPATSIIPFAIAETVASGSGSTFVTYSPTTGVRPLNTSTEFSNSLSSGAANNIRLTSSASVNAPTTVNSLILTSGATSIGGTAQLTISSGALLSIPTSATISTGLDFGTAEANIFAVGDLMLSGAVTGSGGLTKSGNGTLTFTRTNSFTGPLTINAGTVRFSSSSQLGADTGAIVFDGAGGTLNNSGTFSLTLTRPIEVRNGIAALFMENAKGQTWTIQGSISGAGGLRVNSSTTPSAVIRLTGQNSYKGSTFLRGGVLEIASDSSLGSGGELIFSGSAGSRLRLLGDWTTTREIRVDNSATIDTAERSAVLNGYIAGNAALTIAGSGSLTVSKASPFSGTLTVGSGSVRLVGDGSLRTAAYAVRPGAELSLEYSAAGTPKLNETAAVTLENSKLRLSGNPAVPVREKLESVTITDGFNTIEILPQTNAAMTLAAGALKRNGGELLIRGTNLGAASSGSYTRFTLPASPEARGGLLNGIFAASGETGQESFAVFDTSVDGVGIRGITPLSNYVTPASVLDSQISSSSNVLLTGSNMTVSDSSVSAHTLTFQPGSSVTLGAGQKLSVAHGSILARSGGQPAALTGGGTLDLGSVPGAIYTFGDLTLDAEVIGSGWSKAGPGLLVLGQQSAGSAPVSVRAGELRALTTTALRDKVVELLANGAFGVTSGTVQLGGATKTGRISIGAGSILELGTVPSDWQFDGKFSGNGTLRIVGGGNDSLRTFLGPGSSFTGTVILASGRAQFSHNSTLTTGTLVIDGGALYPPTGGMTLAAPLLLNQDLRVLGSEAVTLASSAATTGTGGIRLERFNNVNVETTMQNTGETHVLNGSVLTLRGAQGALAGSPQIRIMRGGELRMENDSAFTGGGNGRLNDAAAILLDGGVLSLATGSNAVTTENVGKIKVAGMSEVQLLTDYFATKSAATISATAIERQPGGILLVGNPLFGAADVNKTARLKTQAPPELVGGGATAGPDTSVVPWVFGHPYTSGASPKSLVTYDADRGFVPLQDSDFAPSIAAVTAPTNNLLLTGANTLAAPLRVNSLVLGTAAANQGSLSGSEKLSVTSGVIMSQSVGTVTTPIDFGNTDGKILPLFGGLTLSGTVSGSHGITKAGDGELILTGQNDFTGPIHINDGALTFASTSSLGNGTEPIRIASSVLRYSGTSPATLTRNIEVSGRGTAIGVNDANGVLTIGSTISGDGDLSIHGPGLVALPNSNTYSGDTYVVGGLLLGSDASLGRGANLYLTGSTGMVLRLSGPWTSNRTIWIANSGAVVDTNGFDAVWNGSLNGSYSMEKVGAGTLTLNAASAHSNDITVKGGSLHLSNGGALTKSSVGLASRTSLVIDNTARVLADRYNDNGSINLSSGAEFKLVGNADAPSTEAVGKLSGADATITISSSGARTVLSANGWSASYDRPILIRGDGLGQSDSATGSRLVFRTVPELRGGLLPGAFVADSASATMGQSFAFYDASSDAYGVIGVRPMRLSDYSSSGVLRDQNHGGSTPNFANVRLTGTHTTQGRSLAINTLTVAGEGTLSIPEKHSAILDLGFINNPVGASMEITGGWLKLPSGNTQLLGDGDVSASNDVIAGNIEKRGVGDFTFTGRSLSALYQYGGEVTLGAGAPFKTGDIINNNGTLATNSSNGRIDNLTASNKVTITGNLSIGKVDGAGALDLKGGTLTITGNKAEYEAMSPTVTGNGTVKLTTSASIKGSFSGPLIAEGVQIPISDLTPLPNITRIEERGGVLQFMKADGVIPSGLPIHATGGRIEVFMDNASEHLGPLSTAGSVEIEATLYVGQAVNRLFSGLQTQVGSTVTFTRTQPVSPENLGKLRFGGDLAGRLVGAGTGPNSTPILPFAIGQVEPFFNSAPYRFVSYSEETGVRPIELTEYASGFTSGANVRLTSNATLPGNVEINALHLFSAASANGTGTLGVTSGLLLAERGGSVGSDATLDFGSHMANIFSVGDASAVLRLDGGLKGTGGMSISGTSRVQLNGSNQISGPVVLNSGTVAFSDSASLGGGSSPVTVYDATVEFTGSTLARDFQVEGYRATFQGGASGTVLSGSISGSGNVLFSGPLTVAGNNSYTGATELQGNITVAGNDVFGSTSGIVLNGTTVRLTSDWHNTRPISFPRVGDTLVEAAIDTNGFNAVFNTSIESFGRLTKQGTGQLTLRREFDGLMLVNGGTVSVEGWLGNGRITVNASGTLSGDGRVSAETIVNGTVDPGVGVGVLGLGDVDFRSGSRLALQLQGATLFDQLDVVGKVSLSGLVDLSLDLGFAPIGYVDTFPIVLNDGSDPITLGTTGRFSYFGNALDENESFFVNSQEFRISYQGGDGNDVVLYAVPEPSVALALFGSGAVLGMRRLRRRR